MNWKDFAILHEDGYFTLATEETGILVNDHGDVPLDEVGPCYKSSEEVIEAVVKAGLATVQYRLWPLASLKGVN